MAPIIPGLTDHEIPKLLQEARARGARSAHYVVLRLPFAVKDLFSDWLLEHYPNKKNKVLHRLEEMRGGKLYDAEYGSRMKGRGPYADHLATMFDSYRTLYRLNNFGSLSLEHFKKSDRSRQLSLF
jgi:DNA repair photolyase